MMMLRQFWQNQYYSLTLYLTVAILITNLAHSSTDKIQSNGLIGTFYSLLNENKKQYQNSVNSFQKNTTSLRNIKKLESVSLSKDFVKSILLHTENKYLKFAENDECKLLSLIDTGLTKTAKGKIYSIPIIINFDGGKQKNVLVTKQDYFNYIYSKKCLNNREMLSLFTSKNISQTIKSLKLSIPKSEKQCIKIHAEWTKNPFLPYICAISESIKKSTLAKIKLKSNPNYTFEQIKNIERLYLKGKYFNKAISPMHKEYFNSLCSNLYEPKQFCAPYMATDIWNKINQQEQPLYKMSYKCKLITKKETLASQDIRYCIEKFNKEPKVCTISKNDDFVALFPMPNCNIISKSLFKSSLYTNYHDCPGNISNHAVTNVHRIIAHKKKLTIPSDKLSCSSQANHSLAKISPQWPLKICYFDKISDKKNCIPYIPNHQKKGDPLSEGHVIAKILYRTSGTPDQKSCEIVADKFFNPLLLKYKHGCFIVYDSQLCTTLNCKKKIIYDLKEIKGIEYVGANTFDYFTNSFKNENFSVNKLLANSLKMGGGTIHNLTFLKLFLEKHSNAIAHGIGCAEDLLPSFFQKKSLTECTPLPFLVDGIVEEKGSIYLSFRSSIDDVHSPRLIYWDNIFNGVSNYKELHPLNTWTFHGIK